MSQTSVVPVPVSPLGMVPALFEKVLGGRSSVFVKTEERQDKGMELWVLELPLHGTLLSLPLEHVPLSLEEMLPVVGDEREDSSETPHVS